MLVRVLIFTCLLVGLCISSQIDCHTQRDGPSSIAHEIHERIKSYENLHPYVSSKQQRNVQADFSILDGMISRSLECPDTPGAAVVVTRGTETLYKKTFGFRNREQQLPVTEETLFAVGSTSKQQCSAMFSILQSEGKLDWGKPIDEYIPSFKYQGDYRPDASKSENSFITNKASLADVLSHRVGAAGEQDWFLNSAETETDKILTYARYTPLKYSFRTSWEYSNIVFELGRKAVEGATGQSIETLMSSKLWSKIGMTSATFDLQTALKTNNYATPYNLDGNGVAGAFDPNVNRYIQSTFKCSGAVNMNLNDLTQWTKFLGQGGKDQAGNVIVPQENLAYTWHGFVPLFGDTSQTKFDGKYFPAGWLLSDYGFGWIRSSYRGRDLYWHNGAVTGESSFFAVMPVENIGFGLMANQNGGDINAIQILLAAIDIALDQPLWLGTADICQFPCPFFPGCPPATKNTATVSSQKRNVEQVNVNLTSCQNVQKKYVGEYSQPGFGSIYVRPSTQGITIVYGEKLQTTCDCVSVAGDTVTTECTAPFYLEPFNVEFSFGHTCKCEHSRANTVLVPGFLAPYPSLPFTRSGKTQSVDWKPTQADQPPQASTN